MDFDFEISPTKIGPSGQRILDRSLEEARRLNHSFLTSEHLFIAIAQSEWPLFADIMQSVGLNPNEMVSRVDECLNAVQYNKDQPMRISPATGLVLRVAYHRHALRAGRQTIEASDIFAAIFEDKKGAIASIVIGYGVDPETFIERISSRAINIELRDERLKKRLELPPHLKQFAVNLNLLARQDRIAPVFYRDDEIRMIMEVLCHRERPNSAMIIGEPGVGKTAIVEGLARTIEFEPGKVPVRLRECQIVSLLMNSMVAGTMLRGMFEDRIQNVIREIVERPNLVLFIDEAHTMMGAGSALGAPSDASNILKSVLARGEVRVIGATTSSEYEEYIKEDEAFARRFRTIYVREPDLEQTREILLKVRSRLERNYAVKIKDLAIDTAIEMSPRYMKHLTLPDKVVGWLDTASVRAEIDGRGTVKAEDVMDVISSVAGIPRNMVARDVTDQFQRIEETLEQRVIGQKEAIRAVSHSLILNKGPLKESNDKPDGVLLFLGPTGVGKTELAKALAEFLFGDDKKMIRIDMSEYQDSQVAVDKLIGMPRGIVGSDKGGILTNQLRKNPYSVVLLDEIEKASPNVLNLFLQAFDEGWLTDGHGKRVYLSDSIIIMTSNLGSQHFRKLTSPLGFLSRPVDPEQIKSSVTKELKVRFSPEFLNRIDEVVIFHPLTTDDVKAIARKYIDAIRRKLAISHQQLEITDDAFSKLLELGYSQEYGARFLKRVIREKIAFPVSANIKKTYKFNVQLDGNVIVVDTDRTAPGQGDEGTLARFKKMFT